MNFLCQKCVHFLLREKNSAIIISKWMHSSSRLYRRKDYYEILGVAQNASQKDIKKSYYELAKKFHPDINDGNQETNKRFCEVSEAYKILSDPEKRRAFDAQKNEPPDDWTSPQSAGSTFTSYSESFHSTVDAEELFRKIFGSYKKEGKKIQQEWIDFPESKFGHAPSQEVILSLGFRDAARGCERMVTVNVVDVCEKCQGSRVQLGYSAQICPFCDGVGLEILADGPITMRTTCRICKGSGLYIKHPCNWCVGMGQMLKERKLIVPVPAGVKDGHTMRVQVQGNELFIIFRISESKYYRSDGDDVHTDATISLSQAVLGGTVKIEGLYDDEVITISPGTDSHKTIRLVGKGLKRSDSYGHGDHFVHLKIKIPEKLNPKQYNLIKSYAEIEDDTPGTITGVKKRADFDDTKFAGRDPERVVRSFPLWTFFRKLKNYILASK